MNRIYTAAVLLLFFTSIAYGQSKFAITYSVAFPTGETSELFPSTSWRGVGFDYSYLVNDNLGVGFSTGWQVFSDNLGFVTETEGTETVSGVRYNYLNSYPLFGTGTYYFKSGDIQPYASLGIGLVYNRLEEDIGLFTNQNSAWQFGIRPELGMDYEIGYQGVGIRAALRYQYVASGSSVPSLPLFSFNVGVVWKN